LSDERQSPAVRRAALRRLWILARPELPTLAAGVFFLLLASAANLAYPQAMRLVIDAALGQGRPGVLGPSGPSLIDRAALAMAAIAVLQGLSMAARYILFSVSGERVVARLRQDLFRAILDQEIGFFDERRTGELTSRLSSDTAVVQGAVSSYVAMGLRHLAGVVGGLALLLYTSPVLTLLMLAVVPPLALGGVAYGRRVRKISWQVHEALAAAGEVAEESIAGIRTVRSFDAEEKEAQRYSGAIQRSFALARRRARASGTFMAAALTAAYAAVALVLWYGGRLLVRGGMTPGDLASFLLYTVMVAMSLGSLADLWAEAMSALGATARIFELMDRTPRMPTAGGRALARVEGRVAFEGVRFAYPSRPDAPVLYGLDLEIQAGEVVALVGPSGAGKSTVAALLGRLYDPTGGVVRLDGCDLRQLDPHWLRRQIGVVSQEPVLFSASIAENIRYGRADAGDAEVEAAARAANVHGFVSRFPEGYATQVGERGIQLSGGQKQRVAIARAVLKDPRLLVLDEATSALDAESEFLVREALERLMEGRTTLIIAHRLSTVIDADRVLVLDGGVLVQSGSHAELMAQGGLYRQLVERQFVAA
jgi:ATP-binding cassette subfamily B protein